MNSLTSRIRSECRYEYHKRFCDVQMVLDGEEWFFNTAATGLIPDGEFDETRDVGFFAPEPPEVSRVTLRPGMFVLAFPWDAHMPAIATGTPAPCGNASPKFHWKRCFSPSGASLSRRIP